MRDVLGINYHSDKGLVLGPRGEAGHHSPGFKQMMKGIGAYCAEPNSIEEVYYVTNNRLKHGTLVISGDHATSHPLFKAVNNDRRKFLIGKDEKVGAVSFDQHVDAYGYNEHLVTKANVYRQLLKDMNIHNVVVVGVRPTEYSIFTGKREDREKINGDYGKFAKFFQRATSWIYRHEFDDIRDRMMVIPVSEACDMPTGLERALRHLKDRGVVHVGLEVDADVFDSSAVTGVGYSVNSLDAMRGPESKFIGWQLREAGMPADNIRTQLEGVNQVLGGYSGGMNVFYRHLTEIEPENEDPVTGSIEKTERLVRAFAERF